MVYENVLKAIGNTPIVRLNRVTAGIHANFYAKLEFMNPGGSIKDRIGWYMIEDAERKGLIKPGGTIVESTSGNTGVGLAIACAIKGYKSIFVLPDKMSNEKIRNLRAFGAKVVVTPTAVEPTDPRSYYSVSRRLAEETPNAIYMNQYDNPSNPEIHYKSTGPEIFKQFPEVDAFFAGIGTGGTVCGCGRYLKDKKPGVKVVAIDPVGSIVYECFKTGKVKTAPKTYKIEGIGEDFIPKNYDFSVLDDIVQVEDKEAHLMTRELLTKEGIYTGVSAGAAVVGAMKWVKAQGKAMEGKNILIILPDSGNRYMSKVFDDDWMREAGFLDKSALGTVSDLLQANHAERGKIYMAKPTDKVSAVVEEMREKGISQMPVTDVAGWIKGIITEAALFNAIYTGKAKTSDTIENLVDASIEFVTLGDPLEKVSKLVTSGRIPLVEDPAKPGRLLSIITKIDLLTFLGNRT